MLQHVGGFLSDFPGFDFSEKSVAPDSRSVSQSVSRADRGSAVQNSTGCFSQLSLTQHVSA